MLLWSKNYEYALFFENALVDSQRVEKFTIIKVNENESRRLTREQAITDSLFTNFEIIKTDSSGVFDLNKYGKIIRKFKIRFSKSDAYFNNYFTEHSFVWNTEAKTLELLSTGLIIKLE